MKDLPFGICFLLFKLAWFFIIGSFLIFPVIGIIFVLDYFGVDDFPGYVEKIFYGTVFGIYGLIVVLSYFTTEAVKSDGVDTTEAMWSAPSDVYHAVILYIRLCIGK